MNDRIFKTAPRRQLKSPQVPKSPSKIYVPIAPAHLTAGERLMWAMETILSECHAKGKYPYAETVVIQEVLRRADLSPQYLEKARRKELKQVVKDFLNENQDAFRSRSYRTVRKPEAPHSGNRVESAELRRIRDCLVLLELELDTATKLLARERAVTAQLNATIDQLRGGSEDKQI